jgi:hypothetical protein
VRAASLAAEINATGEYEAGIAEGETSQFDVVVDGKLLFSKGDEGRYPTPEEILERLRSNASLHMRLTDS